MSQVVGILQNTPLAKRKFKDDLSKPYTRNAFIEY